MSSCTLRESQYRSRFRIESKLALPTSYELESTNGLTFDNTFLHRSAPSFIGSAGRASSLLPPTLNIRRRQYQNADAHSANSFSLTRQAIYVFGMSSICSKAFCGA